VKKTQKEIIQKIATKYNLPLKTVEDIVMHQFKFVSKIMQDGNFKSIRIPYFGKFSSNKNRREYITKLKNESSNNR
jgi:nucleoid DNA-binding protein